MARPKKNRETNTDNLITQLIETVTDMYLNPPENTADENGRMYLNLLAEEFSMTPIKVRKLLISSGVYQTDISMRINKLYKSGKTIKEIREIVGLSAASVSGYLPYQKTVYNLEVSTDVANRLRKYRNRKAMVDKLASEVETMANILVAEINEQKLLERMKAESENMDTSAEIVINLFGSLEIITSKGALSEAEIKSPLACKLLVLLMMNRHRSMTGRELADALWPDADYTDPTGKLRTLLYRFRTTFRLISDKELIITSANGYRINGELSIHTDYENFDKTCEVSKKAYDRYQKKELLCKAVKLYRGKLFPTGSGEHWLLACNSKYHLQYLAIVEELMNLLHSEKNYSMMHEYAMMAVNVEPDNPTVLFWLIVALRKHGAIDMAKEHLESAKIRLLREEYQELEERLIAV